MKHIAEKHYSNHAECSELLNTYREDQRIPTSAYFRRKEVLAKKKYYTRLLIITIIFNIIFIAASFGQLVTNDNVLISNTATITVKGDILNKTGTSITNNGTIDLNGNWVNNSGNNCFGTSAGTVVMSGAGQAINGVSPTAFNNLTLTGSGTKTMMQDITTGGMNVSHSGVLDVGDVMLDLNSNMLTVTNSTSSGITSGIGYILSEDVDNSSKINWQVNNSIGSHVIPFANNAGIKIPLTFDLTAGDAGDVVISTYATIPDNTPYPIAPTVVTHVRDVAGVDNSANTVDRFWQIDVSGNPTAALTFTYAPLENAVNGNTSMRAQRWNDPYDAWDAPMASQSNPTTQSVMVNNVTSFGPWAIALQSSPLPIILLEFDAKATKEDKVQCKWVTSSEVNNDYFTIERSKDALHFEAAGTVDGAGTTSTTQYYSFMDNEPYTGVSYYRLKQTDFDGQFAYSQIVPVTINKAKGGMLAAWPNPSNGIFNITGLKEGTSDIKVFDMAGKLVFERAVAEPENILSIDISSYNKGVYILNVSNDHSSENIKLVVK